MRYGLHGKLTAKPGERDRLVAILLQAAERLESHPECSHYIVSTTEEPDVVWVTEVWSSKEAHAASLELEDVRNLIRQGLPLIAATPESVTTTPLGGKGL